MRDEAALFHIRDSVACTIAMNALHSRILEIVAVVLESSRDLLAAGPRGSDTSLAEVAPLI